MASGLINSLFFDIKNNMKIKYILVLLIIILIPSCTTFREPSGEYDWPVLTIRQWEKMTPSVLSGFLESGCSVNRLSSEGLSPLMMAGELGNDPRIIDILVENNADVNYSTKTGQTALMSAAINEQTDKMITALIRNGAEVDKENSFGLTALSVAFMYSKRPENVMTLLAAEPRMQANSFPGVSDINYRNSGGYNILMAELRNNCGYEKAAGLIEAGIGLRARDVSGWSAGTVAAIYDSNPEVTDLLYDTGVNFKIDNPEGYTTLMLAAARNTNPDVIRQLIKHGEDINARTDSGYTALMFAAYAAKNDSVISMLLECGADTSIKTDTGQTAWDFIQQNEAVKGTRGYWELNDYRY